MNWDNEFSPTSRPETNRKSNVVYQMAPLPMTLCDLEGYFSYFKPIYIRSIGKRKH